MSRRLSKQVLGLFSVLIMFHHMALRTCAPYLPESVFRHGLEPFLSIGYLLVSFFFFCSGYGLIKSSRNKENYFRGFFVKRLNRILFVVLVTDVIYLIFRIQKGIPAFPVNPYSWFIFCIVVLYAGFFLFYRKEGHFSVVLLSLFLLVYTVFCYTFALGNWWFNAAPAFIAGIVAGDKQLATSKKKAVISGCIFVVCFFISENGIIVYKLLGEPGYFLVDLITIVLQMVASCAFSLALYYLLSGMREPSENKVSKVLDLLGGMTLELYLIHGFFVNFFSFSYISDNVGSYFYISNVVLYVLAVSVCSVVAAFLIRKLADFVAELYKESDFMKVLMRDIKIVVAAGLILGTVVLIFTSVGQVIRSSSAKERLAQMKDETVTMLSVNGCDTAVYVTGEGEYTIVLMESDVMPCATLHAKPLADELAADYKVVVIDYPGTGYSGDTSAERTCDFYADTVRGVLEQLDIRENIILLPHALSAVYACRYIEKYPEGVEGVVFVDAVTPEFADHIVSSYSRNDAEYEWNITNSIRAEACKRQLLYRTGLVAMDMSGYNSLFASTPLRKDMPAMADMMFSNYLTGGHRAELSMAYSNLVSMQDFVMPSDLPVSFVLSSVTRANMSYGISFLNSYESMITNDDIQSVYVVNGNVYVYFYNPKLIKSKVDDLVLSL